LNWAVASLVLPGISDATLIVTGLLPAGALLSPAFFFELLLHPAASSVIAVTAAIAMRVDFMVTPRYRWVVRMDGTGADRSGGVRPVEPDRGVLGQPLAVERPAGEQDGGPAGQLDRFGSEVDEAGEAGAAGEGEDGRR
jgi:hypothetical protein